MMTLPFIVIGLLIIQQATANDIILAKHLNESEDLLVNCVNNIIKINFVGQPTVLISTNVKETPNMIYERFTKHLGSGVSPRIHIEDHAQTNSIYMQRDQVLFIQLFDNCEKIINIKHDTIDQRIKHLAIISDFSKENCAAIFERVGKNMSKYDITYLIKDQHDDDYVIMTYIPKMNATSCTIQYDLPATLLSTCSSEENFIAFPLKKPQDFMKCPFKVGMASLYPFSKIANKTSLKTSDPLYVHDGSDFELLKIMEKYFNFTLEFYYIHKIEENPYVIQDFIALLLNGTLDACAGGLYRIYGDIVDYSGVYGRQGIFWMYSVNRDSRSWQNFVTKVNGLYIFVICYACYSTIWYLFCKYDKQVVSMSNTLLYGWGALIGTSSLQDAKSLKQKILNIVYQVMCIHFAAYIGIKMYSLLTILSPPLTYKTNTDLYESGLKPFLIPFVKYFVNDKTYEAFANSSGHCETFTQCGELCLKENCVTVIIDGLFTVLQAKTAVNDEARTLKVSENILTVYHEMLLRKDVSINKEFKNVMMRLEEGGVIDKLYNEAVGILKLDKAETAALNIMSHSYACKTGCSITLTQMEGAFYLWIFGCIISVIAFFVEVLLKMERVSKEKTRRTHND